MNAFRFSGLINPLRLSKLLGSVSLSSNSLKLSLLKNELVYNEFCTSCYARSETKDLIAPEVVSRALAEREKKKEKYLPMPTIIDKKIQGFLEKLMPSLTLEREELKDAAMFTYEDLVDEICVEQFFYDFELPDTFASWFTVVELHTWLVSARIMREDRLGFHARDMITDSFFNDAIYRSTLLGRRAYVYRRRQLYLLGLSFKAAYYGYDEAIQSSDQVLAAMVWRRFFALEGTDARKIERLVKYIRVQMDHLSHMTFNEIVFKRKNLTIPLSEIHIDGEGIKNKLLN